MKSGDTHLATVAVLVSDGPVDEIRFGFVGEIGADTGQPTGGFWVEIDGDAQTFRAEAASIAEAVALALDMAAKQLGMDSAKDTVVESFTLNHSVDGPIPMRLGYIGTLDEGGQPRAYFAEMEIERGGKREWIRGEGATMGQANDALEAKFLEAIRERGETER